MPKQIDLDVTYLRMADEWAQLSKAVRRKVGCLIVKDDQIISDGYNGTPAGFDNTCEFVNEGFLDRAENKLQTKPEVLHAESNALMKLAKSTNSSKDSTIYLTMSPCFDCAKLIIQAGVIRVVFSEKYRNQEGVKFLHSNNVIAERVTVPRVRTISAIHDSCGYDC
jgi:dCMP deaminase